MDCPKSRGAPYRAQPCVALRAKAPEGSPGKKRPPGGGQSSPEGEKGYRKSLEALTLTFIVTEPAPAYAVQFGPMN